MTKMQRKSTARHAAGHKKCRKKQHWFLHAVVPCFSVMLFCFGLFLWKAAWELNVSVPPEMITPEESYRPQVGEPPYRVVVDAGHGGSDPGARGVTEEKNITASTAAILLQWLGRDPNYITLQTRENFDETATPTERATAAVVQNPQLLLSIHANAAANGSSAAGFECYPVVPGRVGHEESLYFAQLLADGMQQAGASLRGCGGVRYIYYLENDQKQLVDSMHTEVRTERSFTILEDSGCPAVLAEQCFVTSAEDVERFGSKEGCQKVARVYYEAICAYFGTEPLPV